MDKHLQVHADQFNAVITADYGHFRYWLVQF